MLSSKSKILYEINEPLIPKRFIDFKLYRGYLDYNDAYVEKLIYNGYTYLDDDGDSILQLDDLIRNENWRFRWKYERLTKTIDSNKKDTYYIPVDLLSSVDSPLYSIENNKYSFNDLYKIEWNNNASKDYFNAVPVKEARALIPLIFTSGDNILYSNEANIYQKNLMNIPAKATKNYYFTANFFKGHDFGKSISLETDINGVANIVALNIQNCGSYCFCVNLNTLLKTIPTINDGKISLLFEEDSPDKDINYRRVDVGVIDVCPKKYYCMWTDKYGNTNSYGFDGNTTKTINNKKTSITTYNSDSSVINNIETDSFNLISEYVNKDIYNSLVDMVNSDYIYVYDVENDYGYLCLYEGSTTTVNSNKLFSFNITVKRVDNLI